jgi:hypothetical protein
MANLAQRFSNLIRLEIERWTGIDSRLPCEHQLPLNWIEALQIVTRHWTLPGA